MNGLSVTSDEYVTFCEGVHRLSNLDLLLYKRAQMERRIRSFAQRRGARRLLDYLAVLEHESTELAEFLDRVTINVSQLWRNPEQWTLLVREVLPKLVEGGSIRAWSAGCSYGAEPYTLAAVCLEAAPRASVEIRGTDLDPRMVGRARVGRFSAEDARDAPAGPLRRWFEPDGGDWVAKPELRGVVAFEVGDLLCSPCVPERYDLVLCRNVVIYFTDTVRDELFQRLALSLRPGGFLMIGSTERVGSPSRIGLAPAHPFVYRKA